MRLIDALSKNPPTRQELRDHLRKIARTATGGNRVVPDTWMSATRTYALCKGDPSLTWLDFYGAEHGFMKDSDEYSFTDFIFKQGHALEAKWVEEILPDAVRVLDEDYEVRDVNAAIKTLAAMASDAPALWKCALWWAPDGLYGSADCLLRSDFFYDTLFPHLKPADFEALPIHWIVVDVKLGAHLDSTAKKDDLAAYSAQVRIYSRIVGCLQGYTPRYAYLVGRDRCLDPLPVKVGMEQDEPLPADLASLRDKFLRIKLHGGDMHPATHDDVAPLFSNSSDFPWHNAKKKLKEMMRPLTMLPHVGNDQAGELRKMGYHNLDDVLTGAIVDYASVNGIGSAGASRIEAVVQAHRDQSPYFGDGLKVPPHRTTEMYVDFEFMSGINLDLSKFPDLENAGCDMVFMIGTGWSEKGNWHYKQWVAPTETRESERLIFEQWLDFLESKGVLANEDAVVYHWSRAEKTQADRAADRHGLDRLRHIPWYDLLKEVFHAAPIGLPTALGFGLKEVATAIGEVAGPEYAIKWPQELCDGLQAMVMGWEMYAQPNPLETREFSTLSSYLEVDCLSMHKVLQWLRDTAPSERKITTAGGHEGLWYRRTISGDLGDCQRRGRGLWYRAEY